MTAVAGAPPAAPGVRPERSDAPAGEDGGRAQPHPRPLLTPRRSNILLALLGAALLPTVTWRAMPLLPAHYPLALSVAASMAVGALSLNLLIGYTGQISLGHGALLGAGSFAAGLVTGNAGLPVWLGVPAAALVGGVIALVIGFPALRLRGLYLAVVTITFGFAMYNFALQLNVFTGGSAGVNVVRRLWGGATFTLQSDMLAVALVVLVLAWVLDGNVTGSKLGRAFRAIRESEAVAGAMGIDVARYKLLAFVLSGALAGVAGALYGLSVYLVNSETFNPTVGMDFSLLLLIVVVVGGLGSRAGGVIAAFVFSLFQFLIGDIFGTGSLVYGLAPILGSGLLMVTVARHPGGFAGLIRERRERRHDRGNDTGEIQRVPALPRLPAVRATTVTGPAAAGGVVLDVRGISKRFGGLVAVDGASIRVGHGEIVGLIGPNGAGKTTLFNCISGLLRPDAGSVRMHGRDISALGAHDRAALGLARTFQQVGLARDQSVMENLLLAQHVLAGYGPVRALLHSGAVAHDEEMLRDRALQAIRTLGFEGREDVPVRLLSGGQQRIVEVACALLTDPDLLMLDEPSAGMAPAVAESLADRLRELRDEMGRTVLIIEHNVPLVLDVCDRVYVLNFGRVLAEGTPDEILSHPEVITAYLGEAVA